VRASLAVIAVAVLTVGCGSSNDQNGGGAQNPGSLEALWRGSGQSVSLIPGTQDYSAGDLRISFLVVDQRARSIERPTARLWIARSRDDAPLQETVARLEPVGVPGASIYEGDIDAVYVARVRVRKPGTYYVLAKPIGGPSIAGLREVVVRRTSASPAVGSKAYPSRTPTLASTGGRLSRLTTRIPPDRELLRHSVADSLADHVPFVVTFATPRYCRSRTCGPVVDVVDHVRRRFARSDIRFIHVEIYEDNDPRKGWNEWSRQWHLPTEPWTFLVGRDGRIKARFEGPVSVGELEAAVRRSLS
jgi:hypothetical protein